MPDPKVGRLPEVGGPGSDGESTTDQGQRLVSPASRRHASRWPSSRWHAAVGSESRSRPLRRRAGSRCPRTRARPKAARLADSSHGVHRAPLRRPWPRPLLVTEATFGPELPGSGHVPSLSFLPTSTACSAADDHPLAGKNHPFHVAGLLHPAADLGVRHVSGLRDPEIAWGLPRDATPFEAFPSPVALAPSPRLPAYTGSKYPRVVGRARSVGGRVAATTPNEPVLDLRVLIYRRIRRGTGALPLGSTRCSHGLLVPTRVSRPTRAGRNPSVQGRRGCADLMWRPCRPDRNPSDLAGRMANHAAPIDFVPTFTSKSFSEELPSR